MEVRLDHCDVFASPAWIQGLERRSGDSAEPRIRGPVHENNNLPSPDSLQTSSLSKQLLFGIVGRDFISTEYELRCGVRAADYFLDAMIDSGNHIDEVVDNISSIHISPSHRSESSGASSILDNSVKPMRNDGE